MYVMPDSELQAKMRFTMAFSRPQNLHNRRLNNEDRQRLITYLRVNAPVLIAQRIGIEKKAANLINAYAAKELARLSGQMTKSGSWNRITEDISRLYRSMRKNMLEDISVTREKVAEYLAKTDTVHSFVEGELRTARFNVSELFSQLPALFMMLHALVAEV